MAKKQLKLYPALIALAALPLLSVPGSAGDSDNFGDNHRSDRDRDNSDTPKRVRILKGKFGWTTQQVCVRTVPNPPGIDQINPNPPNALNVPGEIVSMTGVGTAVFKSDGTMHIDDGSWANELRHSQMAPGNTPMSGGFSPVCDGTWSIGADNRATVDWYCRIDIQSQPGLYIDAGPVNMDGWVAEDGNTIDLNLRGTVQRLTFKMNGTPVGEVQRLCIQRFVFHKLPK